MEAARVIVSAIVISMILYLVGYTTLEYTNHKEEERIEHEEAMKEPQDHSISNSN